ncbi:MAG: sulfatase-like hydrolase/transferase [Polyangiales bacterium]
MEQSTKRRIFLLVKLVATVAVVALILRAVLKKEDADELLGHLRTMDYRWFGLAVGVQLFQVFVGTLRFTRLLDGQGIKAPFRHLFGTMMIGRFFGAVTPAGLGMQGYKLYDIASRTGKNARSAATIGIELLTGQMGFAGVIVIGATIFGRRYVGDAGVLVIDAAFLGLIAVVTALLARPLLFQSLSRRILGGVPTKLQTLVDAVSAYHGKGFLLFQAIALSTVIHVCHNLVYVCAAHAFGLDLRVGEVFFVTSVQILATMVPITVNGVGVREATGARLYSIVGVPAGIALLVPFVGFVAEMVISLLGGLFLLARRSSYAPAIVVEDEGREDAVLAEIEKLEVELPRKGRGFVVGLNAGLLAGAIVGLAEGAVVLLSGRDAPDYGVLWYGVVIYGALLAVIGSGMGFSLAGLGRLIHRQKTDEPRAFGAFVGTLVATVGFGLGAFRIRRDVFHEELVWKSKQGLIVLACVAFIAVAAAMLLAATLRFLTERRPFKALLHVVGTPLFVVALVSGLVAFHRTHPVHAAGPSERQLPAASGRAGNVLFIVVDTLRADHLPVYGYGRGRTPNLDAFARDSVRFDRHFANASWTRPSFASILTGRYAGSHAVMSKADALADQLVTMPEAFAGAGYYTTGFVTNFNVAPFFNFQQGFDEYVYLEPDFVLGANDAQAKLLLAQTLRRVVERFQPARPGSAYQDAETVNRHVLRWLDRAPENAPFFLFAAYMDPHDPYFEHPYRGPGYARATHQEPRPDEADHLRRLYDGEITYWDEQFGRLVAELKRRGLYDQLTIVVTADHGEEFMDHGGFWHGTTLYDEQVRVPLLVKLPFASRGGEVVTEWSQSIDLMPSLLRANDVPPVEGVQGRNDLLDVGFLGATDVFAEESHEGNVLRSLRARRGSSEVKVITANAGNPRGLGEVEMFRVDQDPGELVNVASDDRDVATLVTRRLLHADETARQGRVVGRQIELATSRDECERMKALGYVQDCSNSADPGH